jgi:hypothetical protein
VEKGELAFGVRSLAPFGMVTKELPQEVSAYCMQYHHGYLYHNSEYTLKHQNIRDQSHAYTCTIITANKCMDTYAHTQAHKCTNAQMHKRTHRRTQHAIYDTTARTKTHTQSHTQTHTQTHTHRNANAPVHEDTSQHRYEVPKLKLNELSTKCPTLVLKIFLWS